MSDNKNSEPACYSCHVGTDKEGLSLLEFLCERFRYKNSQEWAKLIQTEAVQLNQKKSNPKQLLRSGDKVSYFVSVTREPKVIKKIPIVYEDADILVVNKPPQLPVHPGGKYLNNTLINLLKNKKRNPLILCHRLDRETSGLCVLAKSQRAKDSLYWQFFENKVQKTYWALVWGIPAKNSGKIDIPVSYTHLTLPTSPHV